MAGYQKNLLKTMHGGASNEVEKLVPNLYDKTRYVLHYCNLQHFLQLGMRLKKIHRAVRFDQSPWMAPYIRMNTDLRKQAKSTFEQSRLIQVNEQQRLWEDNGKHPSTHRCQTRTFCEEEKFRTLIAKPSFNRSGMFDDYLAGIHMK